MDSLAPSLWKAEQRLQRNSGPKGWGNAALSLLLHPFSRLLSLCQAQPHPPPPSFPSSCPFSLGSMINSLLKVSGDRSKGAFLPHHVKPSLKTSFCLDQSRNNKICPEPKPSSFLSLRKAFNDDQKIQRRRVFDPVVMGAQEVSS